MPEIDGSGDGAAAAVEEGGGRKRRRPLRALAWIVGIAVGVPALAAAGLLVVSILSRSDPAAHMPPGFQAYASLPSAGTFVREALDLKALDAVLSGPGLGAARGLVRSLRAQPFLRTAAFDRLADLRVDAALYDGGGFVAAASLGYRSAALRLAPLASRIAPGLLAKVPGLSWEPDATPARFELKAGETTVYAVRYRDLLVVASSAELLASAREPSGEGVDPALAEALAEPSSGSLRFLADPATLTAGLASGGGLAAGLLSKLEFPSLAVVDLTLEDERVALSVNLPSTVNDPGLAPLFGRRSRTPSILSRFPESASYFTMLAAGEPSELWAALSPALGDPVVSAFDTADKASRLALGLGVDELLFSWMGDELGVYGSSLGSEPVFFARIADEKARRRVFDAIFGSLLVGRDVSAMVGDTRVPRIVFPPFLRSFLESLGVGLVEPFYLVEDGYLYVCQSAELLAAAVAETRDGRLLVKTERWKDGAAGVSPESSASLFYSLDRSVPFFMRGGAGIASALKLYGRGVASIRLSPGSVRLELSAIPAAKGGAATLPGFPLDAGGRMGSDPVVGRTASGAPAAFWLSGQKLIGVDLASGARYEAELDAPGWLAVEERDGRVAALWAVSDRGTVYRLDATLQPLEGFPLVTGQKASGPCVESLGRLVVPVASEPALMIVSADGSTRFSSAFGSRPRSAPAVSGYALAALPRSFDSELYLMDLEGAVLPGWPVLLPGIASAAPAFAGADTAADGRVLALTEAGQLLAYSIDAAASPGFPVPLDGSFDAAPVWAPGWRAVYALSVEGALYKVGLDGSTLGSVRVGRQPARGAAVTAYDSDGDGREELYVSGGGDALYAFSGDLAPLPGYPVSGSGAPRFIDIDGDGADDMVARGADDTLRAYSGR